MAKRTGKHLPANAWHEVTNLVERVVGATRMLLDRLIGAVTRRPARPAPKSRATKSVHPRRAPRRQATHRTAKRAA